MSAPPFDAAPAEDTGARTAHRYLFQYCCAAARLLAAIAANTRCELLCEWHEDYLIMRESGLEAVSVKHRENRLAAWTIATLAGEDGNLKHLLDTFERAAGLIDCHFETNRGHKADDLWSTDDAKRDAARDEAAKRLDASRTQVDAFLLRLTVSEPPAPDRQHIVAAYADMYAGPALDRLGITSLSASHAMRVAHELVALSSTDRMPADAAVAILAAVPADRPTVIAAHQLEARRVTDQDLVQALRDAAHERVPRLKALGDDAPPETTLSRKLDAGGLGASTVETARRRRRMWYSHRAAVRDIDQREDELRSLKEWVQDQANTAENEAIDTGRDPYGRIMHQELMKRLHDRGALPSGTRLEDSDPALLAGAAYEMTDDCWIWWSPRSAVEGVDA